MLLQLSLLKHTTQFKQMHVRIIEAGAHKATAKINAFCVRMAAFASAVFPAKANRPSLTTKHSAECCVPVNMRAFS